MIKFYGKILKTEFNVNSEVYGFRITFIYMFSGYVLSLKYQENI
jgi:hypothetical protein